MNSQVTGPRRIICGEHTEEQRTAGLLAKIVYNDQSLEVRMQGSIFLTPFGVVEVRQSDARDYPENATAKITAIPPDPLPGLIEQALDLIPQMPESASKKDLMELTADAIARQIDSAMNPLFFVNTERGSVERVAT